MALAAIYGNHPIFPGMERTNSKEIDAIVKAADKGGREKALGYLWDSVKPTHIRMISYGGPVTQITGHYITTARWVAELIKVDIDKMFKDVSKQKGFTVPKSWAGLNENGSPKKKAAKKSKPANAGNTVKVDFSQGKKKEV